MPKTISREVQLVSRPNGVPIPSDFAIAARELGPVRDGEVLVRNLFMSVDPYMRGLMSSGTPSPDLAELGEPLEGLAVGEVVESRAEAFEPGQIVISEYGWREYLMVGPEALRKVNPGSHPLPVYLGALGMPGMTAWSGLKLVAISPGDVVFISGAAGAVGHVAGQLARLRGCRVIGSAGSAEKVRFLLEECRFDRAFNYKDGPALDQLMEAAPEGIDVYFDNVGGSTLEAALSALRLHGRIIACGSISGYNDEGPRPGPTNLFNIVEKRLTMRGFIVGDGDDRRPEFEAEVGGYIRAGKLLSRETVVQGIEQAVGAFIGLFEGRNLGKMVVKLD